MQNENNKNSANNSIQGRKRKNRKNPAALYPGNYGLGIKVFLRGYGFNIMGKENKLLNDSINKNDERNSSDREFYDFVQIEAS